MNEPKAKVLGPKYGKAGLLGRMVSGTVGDLIFKQRGQWHSFWNDGDEPARMLEIT